MEDSLFGVFHIHRASCLGGALLVIIILLLGAIGYSLARYKGYTKKSWAQTLSNMVNDFKQSCLA